MKLTLPLLLVSLVVLAPAHSADVNLSLEIRLGKMLPPPPPEVIVLDRAAPPGPPPWAPAHGFRRKHDNYYYPSADVYFRPADRVWFYLDGREWRFGASLPTNIRVDFNRSVAVSMETDQPFQFHKEVKAYYPDDYFVSKVKVKEKGEKPDKDKFEQGADDSPGKGNGKGKGKGKNR